MVPATSIRKTTLRGVEENYNGLLAMFRDLDTKAQGIGAVLGLFLTGLLVFIEKLPTLGAGLGRLFLGGFVVGFVVAIVALIACLRLREVPRPWSGVEQMWRDVREVELVDEDIESFEGDLIQVLTESSATLSGTVEDKARWVWLAQIGLVFAIFMTLLLLLDQTNFWG